VGESGGVASPFLTSAISGQLHDQAALSHGKQPQIALNRRLGEPQTRCGR
jgi:hypothetical protein